MACEAGRIPTALLAWRSSSLSSVVNITGSDTADTNLYHNLISNLLTGKLASLNRSWQSKEGTFRALGMAGIEPTPSKSECDWTPLLP